MKRDTKDHLFILMVWVEESEFASLRREQKAWIEEKLEKYKISIIHSYVDSFANGFYRSKYHAVMIVDAGFRLRWYYQYKENIEEMVKYY